MVIIRRVRELKEYDVKEAYGTDAEGVTIRWISEKRTGGEEYLHNFALRYFAIEVGGHIAPHEHPWEQEIAVTRGRLKITGSGQGRIIEKGDVAYFPANEEHGFKSIGSDPAEFYCVIGCIGKGENCIGISEQ
ncbi:MAG: cupin domain-containing protein [Candidatus Bathyarchaeota archaeon]|nr:MAG: cupin domain-containing protein [Candidatus Bathyarchaeota archaeon]